MGTFAAGAAKALYASRSGRGFAGVALFVVFVGCFCFFFLVAPPLSPAFPVFRPGVPWALASCGHPACPPPCLPFFCAPLSSVVVGSGPGRLRPWRSVVLPPGTPLYFLFPPPYPPPLFFACDAPVFCLFPPFFIFFFLFPLPPFSAFVSRLCGAWAGLCVLGRGLCWFVLLWALCPGRGWCALALCYWVHPGCELSVCAVACRVTVLWCVLCFAWWCVACLCWAWFLLRAAAPCCRCLVPCRGPWLCSVLGCGAALLWCAACRVVCCCLRRVLLVVPCFVVRAGWCCVLLPVVAGCSLLGLVTCCCFPLACVVAGAPAWPRGMLPC